MKECEMCGKGSKMAGKRNKLRGHFNPTPLQRKYPNQQKTLNNDGERVIACTQCIKAFSKKTK